MADEKIIIKIDGDTTSIDRKLSKTTDKVDDANKSALGLKTSMDELKTIAVAGFAAISGAVAISIKNFSKFEHELNGVRTLLNKSSFGTKTLADGFEDMKDEMLELASKAPVSIGAMNKALFDSVSAGVEAGEAVEFVGVAAKLATAGLTDVSVATDGMTSALNAYGLSADKAEAVASKFFAAQKDGKTTIEELANGFGLVGATASSFNVSLDELLAATSAVTTAGIKTNAAYTGLNAVFANISKPTADAVKEAKRLGIEFNTTSLRAKGLKGFLDQLTQAQGFNQTSIERLFGSVEAQKIAFALTGEQASSFASTLSTLSDETETLTTFTDAYNVSAGDTESKLTTLANKVKVLSIRIGEDLAGQLLTVTDYWSKFFESSDKEPEGIDALNQKIAETQKRMAYLDDQINKDWNLIEKVTGVHRKQKVELIDLEQQLMRLLKQREALESKVSDSAKAAAKARADALAGAEGTLDDETTEAQANQNNTIVELEKKKLEELARLREEAAIAEEEVRLEKLEEKQLNAEIEQDILESNLTKEQQIRLQAQKNIIKDEHKQAKLMAKMKATSAKNELTQLRTGEINKLQVRQMYANHAVTIAGNLATMEQAISGKSSKAMFLLQKAAAMAQAYISTQLAYVQALATPPPANIPLSNWVLAAGGTSIAAIAATTFTGMANGGLVTGGIAGKDSVPTMLMPGELVVPKENYEQHMANNGQGQQVEVILTMNDNLVDFVEAELQEREALQI